MPKTGYSFQGWHQPHTTFDFICGNSWDMDHSVDITIYKNRRLALSDLRIKKSY